MSHRRFENSKNPFLRKGEAAVVRGEKRIRHRMAPAAFPNLPSVLVNSFPKSGTHLLSQVVSGLPSDGDWGEFFVSTPSLTFREVDRARMSRRLSRLVPGETAKGHLHWSPEHANLLGAAGVVTYFIYRDPRDVAVSEARYLTDMNRFHRLHRHFSQLSSDDERLMMAITGIPHPLADGVEYSDIGQRFARYQGWLSDPNTMAIRFEDLQGPNRSTTINEIVDHYLAKVSDTSLDKQLLRDQCLSSIDPHRSHTFREGSPGAWRAVLTAEHTRAFKAAAGNLLIELGYEADHAW